VCTEHYEAVRFATGGPLIRSYAGTNVGEFFAVATETFFTRPVELAEQKPDLYGVFADCYQQDPADRMRRYVAANREEALARLALTPIRIIARTRPRHA